MNPLPPQAYTKETLVQAYQWLQNQNESIKEMSTNPDILVSLYLKAKLQGHQALERPSIQNFKNELKNLAGMMGEFEVYEGKPAAPAPQQIPNSAIPQQTVTATAAPIVTNTVKSGLALDARSQELVQETQEKFNLSSEEEALRLLIATGAHTLQKILK